VWWIGVYDAAAASSAIISAARLSGVSTSERGRLLELVERSDLVGEGGGGGSATTNLSCEGLTLTLSAFSGLFLIDI
jgi:hypothetical protein